MCGGARIAGDASDARRRRTNRVFKGRASCDGRLTPEKTLNFGTAPGQPRLNFESQEDVVRQKNEEEKKWLIAVTNVQLRKRRRKTAEDLIQSAKPLRQPPP
jgi:hypothetical protein